MVQFFCASATAEKPADEDFSAELPRIPPVEPDKALATFTVQPGYRVELVAAEPLVTDPVAAAFDENGRLYVVEMRGYSEQPDELLSRVRLLEDTDGDGRFDKSTIYADQLSWPTAVTCYDGGIFIGDAPDILYCKDTDGDGRTDERRTVFTGFSKANVQGLLNSFCWGLDNRIHGATSTSGGSVRRADDPKAKPVNLNGRDFAFDPRTLELTATSGGAQHGMSFDAWGRKFVCSNSDHIQQVMYEDRYLARNPFLSAPGPRISIAAEGPQAEVFRTSPVEPWRIVRTRLRVSGSVPGPIEGGGRAAGYFTGATGVTIYKGDAWNTGGAEIAVVGDVGSNLVHRKRLDLPNGLEFVARRIDDKSEFVSSRDIWFRPAQFLNAPDGTLYILDVYREVIEHPASLPPVIKRHLDLTSGRDRGRIYRIVPDGYRPRKSPVFAGAKSAELVELLEHPNAWHRETAARLLWQRQDRSVTPLLENMAKGSTPLGRMHALYALAGLGSLTTPTLLDAMIDQHPGVREHAVKLAEPQLNRSVDLGKQLVAMVHESDARVRFQVAFSLGEMESSSRLGALADLAQRDAGNRWMRLAIQSSLAVGAEKLLEWVAVAPGFLRSDSGLVFLESLARQIGVANRRSELQVALGVVEDVLDRGDDAPAGVIVRGLAAGLAQRGANLETAVAGEHAATARRVIDELLKSARSTAAADEQTLSRRVSAIDTLALAKFSDVENCLTGLLNQRQPQEVQRAALKTLAHFNEPLVARVVLDAWPSLGPTVRSAAAELLFSRPMWVAALFNAIESGEVAANDLDPARLKLLTSHGDGAIRKRAEKLLASLAIGRRQDVVDAYRDVLSMPGDAERGKAAFKKVCAACHRVEGVGQEIGPNLATVKSRGAEAILVNLLDPSREVNPQFVNYVLVTDDGRSLTGMIAAETATSVTLRRAEAASDTVLRMNIDELRSTGQSLMPDGMEKQLSKQDMADLIAYLMNVN